MGPPGFLVQRVPRRQANLANDIPFSEAQGELLPEDLVAHLVEGLLHEGLCQVIRSNPVALLALVELDDVAEP